MCSFRRRKGWLRNRGKQGAGGTSKGLLPNNKLPCATSLRSGARSELEICVFLTLAHSRYSVCVK